MLSRIYSGANIGLDGILIEVEVDVASMGFPTLTIVGLPTKAVDEAKHRVRTAIINSGFAMPDSKITVNLAPADMPKEGSSFDLPIAVGILASSGMLDRPALSKNLFIGELSLEGAVRKIPGLISIALMARKKKIINLFVPDENKDEATLIEGINIYPLQNLTDLILHFNGQKKINIYKTKKDLVFESESQTELDFMEIKGQEQAKRALEIAAVGMHNVHLKGPPGSGKTMLSRAFPAILPPLSKEEILEVSKIYSVCGLLGGEKFIVKRPFRSPHHTTSRIGLIGGSSSPMPGEISLSHRGILFLDEFPEFPRHVIEALRQPIEDGIVTISRASGSLTFPCRFLLIAASNPCPCGYLGHPKKSCKCMPGSILKYRKRLSGPILDRIDIHVDVPPVEQEKLTSHSSGDTTKTIRDRVMKAHQVQNTRFKNSKIHYNSEMSPQDIKKFCVLTDEALSLLKQAINKLSLSARSYFKVIKIAQTIADLSGGQKIEVQFIAEALQYRAKEE